jgi:microcystin degradation protein MlrC
LVEPSRSLSTFEDLAERIIRVDSPGLSTQQLETYDYARLSRPIYPLDEIREPSFS